MPNQWDPPDSLRTTDHHARTANLLRLTEHLGENVKNNQRISQIICPESPSSGCGGVYWGNLGSWPQFLRYWQQPRLCVKKTHHTLACSISLSSCFLTVSGAWQYWQHTQQIIDVWDILPISPRDKSPFVFSYLISFWTYGSRCKDWSLHICCCTVIHDAEPKERRWQLCLSFVDALSGCLVCSENFPPYRCPWIINFFKLQFWILTSRWPNEEYMYSCTLAGMRQAFSLC